MTEQTTRETNRKVVEALDLADTAAERAALEWNRVLSGMKHVENATRVHRDLVDGGWELSRRIGEYREVLKQRLRMEQDGGKR